MTRRSPEHRLTRRLMSLALTVEQLGPNEFFWIVLESFDRNEVFEPLIESMTAVETYADALAAGTQALMRMADDPRVGPQEEVEEEDDFE